MTNKKHTRRALFSSVISLILCCSMLVGTTFAWFTDSVTSANNIIKSGNLDVAMYWADGTKAVPAEESDWTDASTGAIFNCDLWEPGYTEVRHIKIANKGTLALKYQLQIIANGEVSNLADVIDVYYTDPAAQVADRTALSDANKIGTLTQVLAGVPTTGNGNLSKGEDVTLTLALKMQESAGNEYQNLSIGSDFSVILLATQVEAEKDSFDENYDKESKYGYAEGTGSLNGAAAIEIEARELDPVNNTKAATVLVPANAVADLEAGILVTVTPTAQNSEVTVNTDQGAKTYDVSVSNIKEGNTEPIKVELRVGTGLEVEALYHYDKEIKDFTYDGEYVVFYTTSFSPFTVVYKADMLNDSEPDQPGDGNEGEDPDESNLPKATVVNSPEYENVDLPWGSYGQWSPTEGLDSQLEAAYTFSCTETLEQAKENPYANWYCDFYVKLDKNLGANEIFLGGNYGSFGWIGFHNGDLTLEANTEIGLLESVSGKWTYLDVVQSVGTFICGVGDVDDALAGATFTVTLRLTNPEDETKFHDVSTINYTFSY